jgi:hypothetical protein
MNVWDDYYTAGLYPFQDGVIKLLRSLRLPFFLTGGTALARAYLGHRYSDDLDYFVNDDPDFLIHVRSFENALRQAAGTETWRFEAEGVIRSDRFVSIPLAAGDRTLKIDLVNDIGFRVGAPVDHPELGLIDTLGNIFSNKLGALSRYAEKDVADIWAIWKAHGADWPAALRAAARKDAGLDVVVAAEIIGSFPRGRLGNIRWSRPVDADLFMADLMRIAEEMLGITGLENNGTGD